MQGWLTQVEIEAENPPLGYVEAPTEPEAVEAPPPMARPR